MTEPTSYVLAPSAFGPLVVLWQETPAGARVQRVLLPRAGQPTEAMFEALRACAPQPSNRTMEGLGRRITRFLEGADITFPLELLALETCSEFQQRVLRAEHAIPRGRVSTYGRIAAHLGRPGAARAVGAALARNPFPILIPCHRAIRADGTLGGYQGGAAMKQALLAMEGIALSPEGTVLAEPYY